MATEQKFKQTEIGLIPEDWDVEVFSNVIAINPKRDIKKGTTARKISMQKLIEFKRKIDGFELSEFKGGSKFQNEDTLMARITPCLENGKTAYVDLLEDNEIAFGSTEFIVLSGKDNLTRNDFVYYLAISPKIRRIAIQSMTGTSGRQRIQADLLGDVEIGIPSLEEQKSITKILSDFDSKIELLQKQNKTLEAIGQAIFKHWFIDFEFPNEEGKPYKSSGGEVVFNEELEKEIPKGWEAKPLDQIANFLNGLALQKFPPEGDVFLPVIKIKELRQGITEQSDKASPNIDKKYIINDGDVLFSWSGTLMVVIWGEGKGALNQHLFKVTSDNFEKWFYYYWIKNHLRTFIGIAKDKTTTMGHIKRHHLTVSKVLVPNDVILGRMNEIMKSFTRKIIKNKLELRRLISLRDTLLPKLMSGEIRVNNLEASTE